MSTLLSAEKIKGHLNCLRIGMEILVFNTVHSTNDLAKQHLENDAPEGLILIADAQTNGRGRRGRSWASPPGVGLYLSALLKPRVPIGSLPQLTLLAGLAATLAVNEFSRENARLKWPNDVLLGGKKLCGILCETHVNQNQNTGVIVGIGINVNHSLSDFPDELQPSATSLKIYTGEPVDRMALASALIRNLDRQYDDYLKFGDTGVLKQWLENSDMIGKKITVFQGKSTVRGTATGLDSRGRLLVQPEHGGELAFDSGEVSLNAPPPLPG